MPLTITVDVTCDGCGKTLLEPREAKQDKIDPIRWDCSRRFTTLTRVRRANQFYCQECADKPSPKAAAALNASAPTDSQREGKK